MSSPAPNRGGVRFTANPMQKVFIENRPFPGFTRPEDWDPAIKPQVSDLFSCRMGEGKSAALCWAAWFYTKFNPGANCALIRDTWENMRATTMEEFFKWFPPGIMGKFTKSEKRFDWTAHGMRGTVYFLGMDEEKDAGKLQSREFGFFGMDEPSPAAGTGGIEAMIFETAMTRLRQPGMHWYAAKLAQNNPDENHWTYQKFVDPGTAGYTHFQTRAPENEKNLPPGYYAEMTKDLAGRPDLQRRFIEGKFGYQQNGVAVTPRFNEVVHVAEKLEPIRGADVVLSWDGGLTPACTVHQIGPSGVWYILDCLIEHDGGVYQLIEDQVFRLLETRYSNFRGRWSHVGDPSLGNREQSDSRTSAVRVIKEKLGGRWRPGPTDIHAGTDPLNKRIGLLGPGGLGMIQIDRERAKPVWHALRGGWHFPKHKGGVVGGQPVKNHPDSDIGDTLRYFAGLYFPRGEAKMKRSGRHRGSSGARYTAGRPSLADSLRKVVTQIPKEFRDIN